MSLKISIGADHAGFDYKQPVIDFLKSKGHHVTDFGTNSSSSVDYPDFAHPVALSVEKGECTFGILICGSAQGVSIAANKHQGIRAAVVWVNEIAELSRQHNNANIICLPARFITVEAALTFVETFINTEFEGGRHANRVGKIGC